MNLLRASALLWLDLFYPLDFSDVSHGLKGLGFLCSVGMLISRIIELIDSFFGLFLAFDRICPSLVAILMPVLFLTLYPSIN